MKRRGTEYNIDESFGSFSIVPFQQKLNSCRSFKGGLLQQLLISFVYWFDELSLFQVCDNPVLPQ